MPDKRPDSEKIEAALRNAGGPLTIDEICRAAWGRVGERERSSVRVNIHRLDARGLIEKSAAKYAIKE